ncbi:deoxynucleoside triphosphate triphosphohydrolase SAMHD1-like [Antennarius striatus]|uniref:deoxynucleoside triphosphate triphosphohydrolase SAMHD1-like n=1 Tax=Antennarius striatus TaxID=241820 RepID=UPI0035B4B71D
MENQQPPLEADLPTEQMEADPTKVFNDPIHGHIEFHPLLVKIIDTPQFQRLRNIKQLGGAYFVYPGASHNRFEHSLGVSYLAGKLAEVLSAKQPELDITSTDILCVQIAGLCHDLGHGPFSHMFDKRFIPKARPDITWKHETASVAMFDYLVEDNDLKPAMKRHRLTLPEDLDFIKEQIAGPPDTDAAGGPEWPYRGRPKEKSFLYQIVSNKENGIDVDKWDYFARDTYHLGMQNNFDHNRFLKFARVCDVGGQKHICTRKKEVGNLYEMFYVRHSIHRKACQHAVVNIIEFMITEAFLKADKHIQIEGSGGQMFTLSTAIDNMEAYTKLTDHVFQQILNSLSPELEEARLILRNIVRRRHYRYLGEIQADEPVRVTQDTLDSWTAALAGAVPQKGSNHVPLLPEDFVVDVVDMDYGMKDQNPVDKMYFYDKEKKTEADKKDKRKVSKLLPDKFSEQLIRVYYKKTNGKEAKKHFKRWRKEMEPPNLDDDMDDDEEGGSSTAANSAGQN